MVENNTEQNIPNDHSDHEAVAGGAAFGGTAEQLSLSVPGVSLENIASVVDSAATAAESKTAPAESSQQQTAEGVTAAAAGAGEATASAPVSDKPQPVVELSPIEKFQSTTAITFLAPNLPPVEFRAPRRREDDRAPQFDDYDDEPTVRRRTRRRADEDPRPLSDDPNTIVKVRKPREKAPLITEPQKVKGSTRLEAKKQRRRDGREAGRRRSVITESEFLARRESVDRVMVVRSKNDRIQIGVLEDGILAEHYVARSQEGSLIGNVYLGRVQNVLPSMEAAFVDIGRGRNAVLYSGEVDWDAVETGNQPRKIEFALKAGDTVLVQVTKDPVGHKGARLTSQISLPGRYLVYVPNGSMNGISRKLPDTERARLKKILKEVLPDNAGVIVRTAAEGASEEQLTLDVTRLTKQWESISAQVAGGQAPQLLHGEPDMLIKIVRDVFNEDFTKMVISGDDAQSTIQTYLEQVAPDLVERVERYEGTRDLFDEYRISEQISKALDRKVWLPSGGSLVIDRTEAMTVIDVNTGKFVGSGGNLEETVTKNNLEAAEEVVRQLRLRDIGGIIVVDFIDMVLESNRDLVLRRMVECLSRDRTKHQVAEVTSLGLVQMTRKKLGLGLLESFSEPCEVCAGRGIVIHHEPVEKHRSNQGEPRRRKGGNQQQNQAPVAAPAAQAHAITDDAKNALAQIAASTIVHPVKEDGTVDVPAAEVAEKTEPRRGRKRASRRSSSDAQQSAASQQASSPAESDTVSSSRDRASGSADNFSVEVGESHEPSTAAEVPILGIPVVAKSERPARVSMHDAEQILGSVLDSLPEPPAPGRSRSRSRRVTTSALKGGTLTSEDSQES
ncbi:Rne/Rng family ribonuclease [Lysinibacter cavernae]|uniref:Ribonuclease E n=1 Tax=Lysinibacter cavernae TaxID=1640652 RepID=A0A7X5TSY5_9MICO|nr:Rne/Rng family ribonuclease [Lysinibacter cavernae]NIH52733.1 ribonuclease E [Lysinibacter cavernae]